MKYLWWAGPTILSVAALCWANYWPVKPGILRNAVNIGMWLAAFAICAVVWCIGAFIK